MGSASPLIQHINLCTRSEFHACIVKCTILPNFEVKRLHYIFYLRSFDHYSDVINYKELK